MKDIVKVQVTAKKGELDKCETDLLCVGLFNEPKGLDKTLKQLDAKLDGAITKVMELGDFEGKAGSSSLIYTNGQITAKRILLIGLGDKKKVKLNCIRSAAASAANKAVSMKVEKIALALTTGKKFDFVKSGQVMAEGVHFGAYRYDEFMTDEEDSRSTSISVQLIGPDAAAVKKLSKGADAGSAIGIAQSLARTLSNRPANVVYPEKLAAEAQKIAKATAGLTCTVFDDKQLKQKKMGGILAVGQGSEHKPRMIILKWTPKKAAAKSPHVGLIGKAVTFDSGGISIKPSANMGQMKMDMTGGAVVLATIKAVAELKLPVKVTAVICSAENAPGGHAYRPGDVITSYSKKTIEVLNTDAEGRLCLCDGIHYAKELECEPIIDIATLTGACMVALGSHKAALMGNDTALLKSLQKASDDSGEPVWPMPSGSEYTKEMKSKIADLKNIGSRYGGACTAASFLGEFAGDTKWAHLDIAGKMEPSEPIKNITTDGSIGFGVRLFVSFLSKVCGK